MDNPVERIRSQFPALCSDTVFFDNPGGTQVPRQVIGRMGEYLQHCNANHGGLFPGGRRSDAVIAAARAAAADLLHAAEPAEIVFGANMTTLTLALARSLARWIEPGDEIMVTRLDHDANISPWLILAEERRAVVRWIDVNEEDLTLKWSDFSGQLSARTRIVAVGYASNAVGTVNPVGRIARAAREAGALVFVDAVHYAPHGAIDVQELQCDFLACSPYKFFGPHMGLLYGRRELLERLPAYKVRPAGDRPPDKFETGTQNHEAIAGFLGLVEYLEWLGPAMGWCNGQAARPERLAQTMEALRRYEQPLAARLIERLRELPGVRIWGVTDPGRLDERVPTVSFTRTGVQPQRIAEELGAAGINVWSGHYYAVEIMRRLGLLEGGGMLRVGLVHYNTFAEIDRLLEALRRG